MKIDHDSLRSGLKVEHTFEPPGLENYTLINDHPEDVRTENGSVS